MQLQQAKIFNSHTVARASAQYSINFPKSVNILREKIDLHNTSTSLSSEKIKTGPAMLAEKLIQIYRKRFTRWQASELFQVNVDDMPTLSINNMFLAGIMACTDRTVRNYRDRLKKLGFIAKEIWHGSNQPFEIVINPEFLFIADNSKSGARAFTSSQRQIFPLISSSTEQEPLTRTLPVTITGKPLPEPENGISKEPETASSPTLPERVNRNDQPEVNFKGKSKKNPIKITGAREDLLRRHAKSVLLVAQTLIFKEEQEKSVKIEAFKRIMELYGNAPREKFPKITANYCARVRLCEELWEDQHGSFPRMDQFFDYRQQVGFISTKNWVQKYGDPTEYRKKKAAEKNSI
jgi:hypothetical protein